MTETEALRAFHAARGELQAALAAYQGARAQLHRVTGKWACPNFCVNGSDFN
ncbi:hypothetical protein [Acidovorax sp. MR-S7]|uniref:hypothetical protein n=1 Tax=Acidovorax sp. MR-S7 TaxID=1268622 RepID=UPI000379444E|nr:hypothetical protein [Acidovorax sp. MR-S7]GAD22648.1 hypothetical protein AVS7_02408 [Acidovorax sp. MR-S7]